MHHSYTNTLHTQPIHLSSSTIYYYQGVGELTKSYQHSRENLCTHQKMVSERAQDIRAKVYAQCKEEDPPLSLKQLKAKVKKLSNLVRMTISV